MEKVLIEKNEENENMEEIKSKVDEIEIEKNEKIMLIWLVVTFFCVIILIFLALVFSLLLKNLTIIATYQIFEKKNITLFDSSNIKGFNKNILSLKIDGKKISFEEDKVYYTFVFEEEGTHILEINFRGKLTSMKGLFNNIKELTMLDLTHLDLEKVTDLSDLVNGCENLSSIFFIEDSNGIKNVQNMSNMFNECLSLNKVEMESFKTSKVTDMTGMFNNCSSLISVNLKKFQTNEEEKVNISYLFYGCSNLKLIDFSNFNFGIIEKNESYIQHVFEGIGKKGIITIKKGEEQNSDLIQNLKNNDRWNIKEAEEED